MKEKTLKNSEVSGATKNVSDLVTVGNGDSFRLLCKAYSLEEGWMKSSKAYFDGRGCFVQVTTQQKNQDGTYSLAEALSYSPGVHIVADKNQGRKLAPMSLIRRLKSFISLSF